MEKINDKLQWKTEMLDRFGIDNMKIVNSKSDDRIMIFLNGKYNDNVLIGKFDNVRNVGHIYDRRKSKRVEKTKTRNIQYDDLSLEDL